MTGAASGLLLAEPLDDGATDSLTPGAVLGTLTQ